jgi:hypothetical protein
VIVPEIITGRRTPRGLEGLVDREERGLGVERVEDRLDEEQVARRRRSGPSTCSR